MGKLMAAYTTLASSYPGYVNVSRRRAHSHRLARPAHQPTSIGD
jgi:hypothetical protein